ncbi:unnamed protein product [Nezara viridula]|nr:unnamed protein product [Nezara viridula]
MEDLRYFWDTDSNLESPINVLVKLVRPLTVPKLLWYNVKVKPYKTKITNNGYSVFVTSKWGRTMPFISDGPLAEKKFLFYNMHFHWSDTNAKGSEHKINHEIFPFEMHVLWRNEAYKTARKAKREYDGIVIMAYLFEVSPNENQLLEPIVDCLEEVKKGVSSTYMKDSASVSELIRLFEDDYFLYRGCVKDSKMTHQVTWMVSKQIQQIGTKQIAKFRHLLKTNGFPIARNSRGTTEMSNERMVYHVRPRSLSLAMGMHYNRLSRTAFFYSYFQRTPFMIEDREPPFKEGFSKGKKIQNNIRRPYGTSTRRSV